MLSSISILIKTFERPKSLHALLQSIADQNINCPIFIADDSKISGEKKVKAKFGKLSITYINLPFDTGLSKGRNILLDRVNTPYFLLCDDDFVFDKRCDLTKALTCLIENDLDIIGGDFYNYIKISNLETLLRHTKKPAHLFQFIFNNYKISRYIGKFELVDQTCKLLISNVLPAESPYRCDLVNNFFLAKTSSVKTLNGWDPLLKLGEHEDFFLRAKQNNLKVAYLSGFGTRHYPIIKAGYKEFRIRALQYKKNFVIKHGFKKYQEINVEKNKVTFEL